MTVGRALGRRGQPVAAAAGLHHHHLLVVEVVADRPVEEHVVRGDKVLDEGEDAEGCETDTTILINQRTDGQYVIYPYLANHSVRCACSRSRP